MKKIKLTTVKIKDSCYLKIPDVVAEAYHLENNDDLEVTLHSKRSQDQVELWDLHPEDLDYIEFKISEEVHTINMYNRIYVPQEYRFFFPKKSRDFLLSTNIGNIKTHITSNGYFTKGLRQWFAINGPIMPEDTLRIKLIDEESNYYDMIYEKILSENK